jgi:hypothetical protein
VADEIESGLPTLPIVFHAITITDGTQQEYSTIPVAIFV